MPRSKLTGDIILILFIIQQLNKALDSSTIRADIGILRNDLMTVLEREN